MESLVESPLGLMRVVASESGLEAVQWVTGAELEQAGAFAADDARGPRSEGAPRDGSGKALGSAALLAEAERQLAAYFAGRLRRFDLPLAPAEASPIAAAVREFLPHVPYGATMTYGQVAAALGRPQAARAVGSACAGNPLLVVLPCHRIIRADGNRGDYAGGLERKTRLLELEATYARNLR